MLKENAYPLAISKLAGDKQAANYVFETIQGSM
jgi:hypothetical protein